MRFYIPLGRFMYANMCIIPCWRTPKACILHFSRRHLYSSLQKEDTDSQLDDPLFALFPQTKPYMALPWLSVEWQLEYIWDHFIVFDTIMVMGLYSATSATGQAGSCGFHYADTNHSPHTWSSRSFTLALTFLSPIKRNYDFSSKNLDISPVASQHFLSRHSICLLVNLSIWFDLIYMTGMFPYAFSGFFTFNHLNRMPSSACRWA